ncbi:MAG: rhomboid family intramembrane serine protease [Candidatus Aminicenantes bacterium]|nr:rhomboid family intramembrane serine protease [Candidatus Aminicenantes bacterium]
MIIPVGHESDTVRRLPWITFIILAACIIVHIFISQSIDDHLSEVGTRSQELLHYYFQHPYLKFDPDIQKKMFGDINTEGFERQLEAYRRITREESLIPRIEEQVELNRLSEMFREALQDVPYRKWGYIPAEKNIFGLLTYMFIHGGFLHLLGNLIMLYLMGPFIEDVWGRPIFMGFYLVMGVLSAFLYGMNYPELQGPLIGASGAIAGVMGAFFVRYLKTKITFFYFFFPFFRGTFQAPAWLMLPLWFLLQIFNAKMIDSANSQGGSGVAYWAHIWGFLLGAVVAYGMKVFKVEEKYIHTKIEAKIDTGDALPKAINEVIKLKRAGKFEEAFSLLSKLAGKHAANPETAERLWDLGTDLGINEENENFFTSLIEKEIRRDQMEQALQHYRQLKDKLLQFRLHPTYKVALMDYLVQRNEVAEANRFAYELLEELNTESSPGLLVKFAFAALKLDPSIAQKAIELCEKHPEITPDQRAQLKQALEFWPPNEAF